MNAKWLMRNAQWGNDERPALNAFHPSAFRLQTSSFILLVISACLLLGGCGQPPLQAAAQSNARISAAADSIAGAAVVGAAATTQAADAVQAAQSDVQAQAASQPTPHLTAAQEHLATASASLQQVAGQWVYVVWHVKVVQVESPKLKSDLANAQKQYDDLSNLWLVKVYRWFERLTWFALLTVGGLLVALGVVGIWYGANKVTSPALGWVGTAINAVKTVVDEIAWWIWSFVPVLGGHVYDWLRAWFTKKGSGAGGQGSAGAAGPQASAATTSAPN